LGCVCMCVRGVYMYVHTSGSVGALAYLLLCARVYRDVLVWMGRKKSPERQTEK
jgi:hypothetical protein